MPPDPAVLTDFQEDYLAAREAVLASLSPRNGRAPQQRLPRRSSRPGHLAERWAASSPGAGRVQERCGLVGSSPSGCGRRSHRCSSSCCSRPSPPAAAARRRRERGARAGRHDGCGRRPVREGRARARQPRHADDRHRQPRVPALVRRRGGGAVEDQRPDLAARASRARSPTRWPASSASRRARSSGRSSRSTSRSARARRTSTSTSTRSRITDERKNAVDFSDRTTTSTRRSSRRRARRSRARRRRRPQGREARRADRDDEPRLHPGHDPAERRTRPSTTPPTTSISALKAKQIDGIVVDLPTAFYIVAAELDDGEIVGQFPAEGEQEQFGMVFEKGSPLVACVNEALAKLKADGDARGHPAGVALRQGERSRDPVDRATAGSRGARASSAAGRRRPQPRRSRSSARSSSSARSRSSSSTRRAGTRCGGRSSRASSSATRCRRSRDAFRTNVRIFLVAEVVILVTALAVALLRSLPGPVFFPVRMLAVAYVDLLPRRSRRSC